MWESFVQEFTELVKGLSYRKQLLLALLTCEKIQTVYFEFSRKESWGDPRVFNKLISLFQQEILNEKIDEKKIFELKNELDKISPDLDAFDHSFASYALDACICFDETISFVKNRNLAHLINMASAAYNLVDMFVQEKEDLDPNDPSLDLKISNDIFMKREIERQKYFVKVITDLALNEIEFVKLRVENNSMPQMVDLSILNNKY